MKILRRYFILLYTDRTALRSQLWMVYNRYRITTAQKCFLFLSKRLGKFVTVHYRPITTTTMRTWSDPLFATPLTAIVLQGPLVTDHHFTTETVRLYKKHWPKDTIIIVSTHTGSDEATIQELRSAGAEVVLHEPPTIRGIGNVNLQLASTLNGIITAKAQGAEFVYKTRCDQRMYGVNVNEFLLNLIKAFPVAPGYTQKYRIVASSFLTLKYTPYLITDMLQFGHIDDMIEYWSAAYDERSALSKPLHTVQDVMDARIAESYLASEFLVRIGRPVTWTIEDSWRAYADHFCIVDRETLDLFWYKYDFYKEYHARDYGGISNSQLLTFAEWFNLYSGRSNKQSVPQEGLSLGRLDYLPHYPLTSK